MQSRILWIAAGFLQLNAIAGFAANTVVTVGPGLTFSPASVTINAGDTVTFTNAGGFHNVVSDTGLFRCANGCQGSGGNGSPSNAAWSSTVTFPTAGTFGYFCEVHGSAGTGMAGSVVVQNPVTTVAIGPGFTGAWFDPNQSGHGLFLEVLPNNLMLAWWFTFNPEGTQQAWFGGTGPITGNTAVVTAAITTGGRWIPNFDPNSIVNTLWGTFTFTFTDCNHGRVEFSSVIPGYGSGSMALTRITEPASLTCP